MLTQVNPKTLKVFTAKFLAFYLSCLLCYTLQTKFGFSPVLSSALIGFVGSFYWFSSEIEKSGIHAVIYAGSFAGMAQVEYLSGPGHILLISLIGTSLYLWSRPHLSGFGGKLGTIAFITTIIMIILNKELLMTLIITLIVSQVAAQLTHALALTKRFGSVRASSFLTLLFIAMTSAFSHPLIPVMQAVFLGSSFVGMTDPKRLSRLQIALSSVIFSFIFHFLILYMKGPGGVLGLSAFASCLIVHFIWRIGTNQVLRFRRPKPY